MKYLAVKNYERFQHYKDRSPEWVKLYTHILEDYDFLRLSDVSRAHLVLIWVLASRVDNKIPNDVKWVTNTIHAHRRVNLDELVDAGFLEEWDAERAQGKREQWASRYVADEVRERVLEKFGRCCVMCGSTENLEIDHVQPISRGGNGNEDNLQPLCRSCNRKKRAKLRSEVCADAGTVATQKPSNGVASRAPAPSREKRREETDTAFDETWSIYPHRSGSNPRRDAEHAHQARVHEGEDPQVLRAGTVRYAAYCVAMQLVNTPYVMQGKRFYGPSKPYLEPYELPSDAAEEAALALRRQQDKDEQWLDEQLAQRPQ